jgi:hypothetical protein
MKSCPYCGGQYADEVAVCPVDQYELTDTTKSKNEGGNSRVTCPACGVADDFTFTVEPRGSFSLPAFLAGGILAVIFRNFAHGRRVRCNKCEARFYYRSPLSKVSRVIFWILVTPAIITLIVLLIHLIVLMVSS